MSKDGSGLRERLEALGRPMPKVDIDGAIERSLARWAAESGGFYGEIEEAPGWRGQAAVGDGLGTPEMPAEQTRASGRDKGVAGHSGDLKPGKRQRRPDFVAMVKRAQAEGLGVRAVNVTANSVLLTLNDDEPATDASVIETADELRKLI
jgi:hypothetical protein